MATFSSTVTITDQAVKDPKTDRGAAARAPSPAVVAAIGWRWLIRLWRAPAPDPAGADCRPGGQQHAVCVVHQRLHHAPGPAFLDDRTGAYVSDWLQVNLPTTLLLVNTFLLLLSSLTVELARRQITRQAALAPSVPFRAFQSGRNATFPGLARPSRSAWLFWRANGWLGANWRIAVSTSPPVPAVPWFMCSPRRTRFTWWEVCWRCFTPAPRHCNKSGGRSRHRGGRDRMVLALHGAGVALHLCAFGV